MQPLTLANIHYQSLGHHRYAALYACAACAGFPEKSIFYGRDIKARVHVDWGTFSLVAALKELITAALKDPLNQKFMLLSESGIPLYPGETLWVELMVEEKSRINACELGVRLTAPDSIKKATWRRIPVEDCRMVQSWCRPVCWVVLLLRELVWCRR